MATHVLINISIDSMAMVMLLIILGTVLLQGEKNNLKRPFVMWILNLVVLLASHIALWFTNSEATFLGGFEGADIIRYILLLLDFFGYNALSVSFYTYVVSLLAEEKEYEDRKVSIDRRVFVVWLFLITVIFAGSIWTKDIFRINEGWICDTHRFVAVFILMTFGPFVDLMVLLRNKVWIGTKKTVLFMGCLILPMFVLMLDLLYNLSISYVVYAFMVLLIYLETSIEQGKKLLLKETEFARNEAEMTNMRMDLMMAQIQPHFLYNTLSSIAFLCWEDSKEAEAAINEFANYMKINLWSVDSREPIPFAIELNQVENYLKIQKRRFGDRLYVKYDIIARDFLIPALTLQTIVENSVKHALEVRFEPTTIEISTLETDFSYVIVVKDDGPGFDTDQIISEDNRHLGVRSTRKRLAEMMGGKLMISSKPGEGTRNMIIIPKRGI